MKIFSEKPQKTAELEWWFCHGNYQFSSEPPTFFMTSFFKALLQSPQAERVGYSLLTAVLSPDESSHSFTSCVEKGAQSIFLENAKEIEQSTINSHLKNAYLDEIKRFGPPSPIVLKKSSPLVSVDFLDVEWDSYRLFQKDDTFRLRCNFTEEKDCDFTLTPQYARLNLRSREHSQFGGMAYFTYPHLTLSGSVNGKEITGSAWLDHQYGDFSWFSLDEKKEPLCWVWAGINLNDGTDVIFMRHMNAKTQQPLHNWLHIRHASGRTQKIFNINLHISREWESPLTHIHYPIELRLEVPEIDLVLDLKPLADDQEIPYFGIQRAIWEGAGLVSGTYKGCPVSGNARIELSGFGYVFDSKDYIDNFVGTIDSHLEDFFPKKISTEWIVENIGEESWQHEPKGITEIISKPAWDFLSRNGKHWRPLCSMLLVESTGISSAPYAQMISAFTELNHSGSLIIDDIEDDSLIRRGEECLHLRYGIDVAINVGNTLYFLPYLLLKNHPHLTDRQRLELYKLVIQVWTRAHFGQGLDIYWSKNLSRKNLDKWLKDSLDEKLLQMYSYKTGASVEAVGEMACILSKNSKKTRKAFAALGRVFGVAFQIIDDIHNFNESPGWTKICGEDIIAGKTTYVIVTTINMLTGAERKRFLDIFCSSRLRKKQDCLKEAIAMVRKSGALEVCRTKAEDMIDEEWKIFNRHALHCDAKIMLRMLISALLNYSYDL